MSQTGIPCVAGLFTEEGGARIFGSKCTTCGTPYFPKKAACHNPDCSESKLVDCEFGGKGVMENGLRLVGQMVNALEEIKVGAKVELVIDTVYHEEDKAYTSWKFKLV